MDTRIADRDNVEFIKTSANEAAIRRRRVLHVHPGKTSGPRLRLKLIRKPSRSRRRRLGAAAVAALLAASNPTAGQEAPFAGLQGVDGMGTSNDGHRIWLMLDAHEYRLDYGKGRRALTEVAEEDRPFLEVTCRADGRARGLAGGEAPRATVNVPMHPDAPDVHVVLSPWYWVLGLTGREYERTPVHVSVTGLEGFDGELVRKRIDYSFRRPAMWIDLRGSETLRAMSGGSELTVTATGEDTEITLRFRPEPGVGGGGARGRRGLPALTPGGEPHPRGVNSVKSNGEKRGEPRPQGARPDGGDAVPDNLDDNERAGWNLEQEKAPGSPR